MEGVKGFAIPDKVFTHAPSVSRLKLGVSCSGDLVLHKLLTP